MECYEGATMNKTYRGQLADGGVDEIHLRTNKGDIGYKIVKFELLPEQPGNQAAEAVVTISRINFTPLSTIDLTDGDILAVGVYAAGAGAGNAYNQFIIMDQEIFNQNIFIGNQDIQNFKMNYYLELEQVKLNENESTMATLQSMRRLALPRN